MVRFIRFALLGLVLTWPALVWGQGALKKGEAVACASGFATRFPCQSVDLMAQLSPIELGGPPPSLGGFLSDLWGWVDPETDKEYALVGLTDGTAFVDVSDPVNPILLGTLPQTPGARPSAWRDIKVYQNYAFIVADNAGAHGLQVFDLTQLRNVPNPPAIFSMSAHYSGVGSSHNLALNEETGFAYAVGGGTCGGGPHVVDVRDPLDPQFVGCYRGFSPGAADYTHDAQCVLYHGPDADYQGREICFLAVPSDEVLIVDFTDKDLPVLLARTSYPRGRYSHQGWLTEDHRTYLHGDEADESSFGFNTRTLIFDVTDLDEPTLLREYFSPAGATDHNTVVRGRYAYQGNYRAGLRILDLADPANPVEAAFFDTFPANDATSLNAAWAAFPFPSGTVAVSDIEQGLFVVQPRGLDLSPTRTPPAEIPPIGGGLSAPYPNPFRASTRLTLTLTTPQPVTLTVYDVLGREVTRLHDGLLPAGAHAFTLAAALAPGSYLVRVTGPALSQTRIVTVVQ